MHLLLPWLWDTIKGTAVSASAPELSSAWGEGGGRAGAVGGLVIHPAAAEGALLFIGRSEGVGYMTAAMSMQLLGRVCLISFFFIHSLFEQLY